VDNLTETLARRAAERSLADRQASYALEIQRIIDATYRVIGRTGSFDPTLRDILQEAGLSTQAFYKHFRSKDEVLLVLLDDGRQRLLGYLGHRMRKATTPAGRVQAWIEGVLAQAANPDAASRTRPFMANRDRLAERFPAEQQASVDQLVDILAEAVGQARAVPRPAGTASEQDRRDAMAIYHVSFGALHAHLVAGTRASAAETHHLVRFSLAGVAASERDDDAKDNHD
jgi:AcrR family transcriptional regulator